MDDTVSERPSGQPALSPSATEPEVSALSGNDQAQAEAPRYLTVGFIARDHEAFQALWADLSERYDFLGDSLTNVRAFAVSANNMFAQDEALVAALDSELDSYDLKDFIEKLIGCEDVPALCREWGVEYPEDKAA